MKTLLYLTTHVSLFLIFSCGTTSKISTGEVEYLGKSEQGTILVTAAGYGTTEGEAMVNAEINAFKTLVFKGVPGSQYHLPMVPDEAAARQQHGAYFQHLLEQGGYEPFLVLSEPHSRYTPKASLTQQIKINVASLRRDMEQQGVVRKFGL